MKNICVLDASVALAWIFPDENDEYAGAVCNYGRRDVLLVPEYFHLEILNALWTAVQKNANA